MKLFYSYAEEDDKWRKSLASHLTPLKLRGLLDDWHDGCVLPGEDRGQEIDRHFEEADLILLLLSPAFLTSNYCYTVQARRALERHEAGTAWVAPVLVRPVDWGGTPIARLQALPQDARPVSTWRDQDRAWLNVAEGVQRMILGLRARRAGGMLRPADVPEDQGGDRVYLSSELFGFTKPWCVSLSLAAGVVLDRIIEGLKLPARFDHEGRIGMTFDYQLGHGDRVLARAQTLASQGVRKNDVLELLVTVRPYAAAAPARHGKSGDSYRGLDAGAEATRAVRALLAELITRAGW